MRLKYKLKDAYWQIKYAIQRVYKGYDNRDVFAFDYRMNQRTLKILKEFKESNNKFFTAPIMYESLFQNKYLDKQCLTVEQTDIMLDMMIFHLEMSDEDSLVDKLPEGYNIEDEVKAYKIARQNEKQAWKLITLFWSDIWC